MEAAAAVWGARALVMPQSSVAVTVGSVPFILVSNREGLTPKEETCSMTWRPL